MVSNAYNAVRHEADGAGVAFLDRGWIKLQGRDRHAFLNGQITNDVLHLEPGRGVHACLLNNVGHMLANIYVHATTDCLWIETNAERAEIVVSTLKRFLIREKVVIEDWTPQARTITIQGQAARRAVSDVMGREMLECCLFPVANEVVHAPNSVDALIVNHVRAATATGFDLMLKPEDADRIYTSLLQVKGVSDIDDLTMDILRVESGIPKWGAELDESVIPLEANLELAINQNKGCYMGQEVIARILSRGHTNRSLVGLKFDSPALPDAVLTADHGPRRNQNLGRVTSIANSPDAGIIGLGFVRNEYCELGIRLMAGEAEAVVTALPFVA